MLPNSALSFENLSSIRWFSLDKATSSFRHCHPPLRSETAYRVDISLRSGGSAVFRCARKVDPAQKARKDDSPKMNFGRQFCPLLSCLDRFSLFGGIERALRLGHVYRIK